MPPSCAQLIDSNGYQNEVPDIWLTQGNPWEIPRLDIRFKVGFFGRVEKKVVDGKEVSTWIPGEQVRCRHQAAGSSGATGQATGIAGKAVSGPTGSTRSLQACTSAHSQLAADLLSSCSRGYAGAYGSSAVLCTVCEVDVPSYAVCSCAGVGCGLR